MPDFIQPEGNQQPEQGPTSGAPPVDFIAPNEQAGMAEQAVSAGQAQPPPPQGIPAGAGMGATQEDPFNAPEEEASPEEQEQYLDLSMRLIAAVNDVRGDPSPADAVIEMLSVKDKPAHIAIGQTAGMVLTQMRDMAKRAGKEYPPVVIQEAGLDLIIELLDIAQMSGAINNIPEEDSPEYQKLVELSALEGAKLYGEWLLRTGQAPRDQAAQEVQKEMRREADAGELDDWGMEELDPQLRARLMQQVQQQQGGQAPAQPEAAPPQPMPPQGGM